MSDKVDVILLAHPVHADIPEDDMRAVVPETWIVRRTVEVKPARLTFDATRSADWSALAREQTRQWRERVVPELEKYPGATLVYFGLAPIPLALHLGSLTERLRKVAVYQRHHKTHSWAYSGGAEPEVKGPDAPKEPSRSADPAIITISTTAIADVDAARAVVGVTSVDIDIRTDPMGEDVLVSAEAVQAVAERFQRALELLESNRPSASEVHVFGAIPGGLAFLLGTYIVTTRHARVVTYQYHRTSEPRLIEALRLPVRADMRRQPTEEEVSAARVLRERWEDSRSRLDLFVRDFRGTRWAAVLGDLGQPFGFGAFAKLENAATTPLVSPIDLRITEVEDDFHYDFERCRWVLGDALLATISQRLKPDALDRAGRMLLLHESLHHGRQRVNASTAPQIRLAPKVLEELDYLADVWAIAHEFAFSGLGVEGWEAQRAGIFEIVRTAVGTMWAFDVDRPPGLLEIRRINRYLIWYASLARLQRATSIEQVFAVLAEKPILELVGPQVELRDGRLVALLDRPSVRPPELCFIDRHGRLCRFGDTSAMSVSRLAQALGAHDGDAVLNSVSAFLGQADD